MDLNFSAEDEQYRQVLKEWLACNHPDRGNKADPVQAARKWQNTLYEAGYVGLPWPKEYGGQNATLTQQVIVSEELARAKAPPLINTIGLTILGPTLIQHASEDQKQRFLPKILNAEELWCQGFSEPGAGSDLASLGTRAVIDGEDFVVNGQKVWTSLAPIADWCFLLVRTDTKAPKREGITYLLCDMKTPGITVRPLRNAGGGTHFSEVFLEEVRIPRVNMVGELNGGWQIARSTLDNERSGLAGVISIENTLDHLWSLAASLKRGNHVAIEESAVRQQLTQLWIEKEGLKYLGFRNLSDQLAGRPPGASASVGKLFASKLRQKMGRAGLDIAGPFAQVSKKSPHVLDRGRWQAAYFDSLGYSIGGGTSEIMHNVIAERVLGLPKSVED
jgi:alkylation response protein AidB-like acyl-CoA dehydrogenase